MPRPTSLAAWTAFLAIACGSSESVTPAGPAALAGVTQVTTHPAEDRAPSWSPDGKYLLFRSDRSGNADIFRVRKDGSDLQPLTTDEAEDIYPAFSPDGERIVFQSDREAPSRRD